MSDLYVPLSLYKQLEHDHELLRLRYDKLAERYAALTPRLRELESIQMAMQARMEEAEDIATGLQRESECLAESKDEKPSQLRAALEQWRSEFLLRLDRLKLSVRVRNALVHATVVRDSYYSYHLRRSVPALPHLMGNRGKDSTKWGFPLIEGRLPTFDEWAQLVMTHEALGNPFLNLRNLGRKGMEEFKQAYVLTCLASSMDETNEVKP